MTNVYVAVMIAGAFLIVLALLGKLVGIVLERNRLRHEVAEAEAAFRRSAAMFDEHVQRLVMIEFELDAMGDQAVQAVWIWPNATYTTMSEN